MQTTSTIFEPLLCYKSFKQIILILITHCLVSIVIPVFCGDKKRQFNEIEPLPDAAELVGFEPRPVGCPHRALPAGWPINRGKKLGQEVAGFQGNSMLPDAVVWGPIVGPVILA